MTERPILFSGPMVRAILAGTKTVTRRLVTYPHGKLLPSTVDRAINVLTGKHWSHPRGWIRPYAVGGGWVRLVDERPPEDGWYRVRWADDGGEQRVLLRGCRGSDWPTWAVSEADDPESLALEDPQVVEWWRPGDRLWVRETWGDGSKFYPHSTTLYRADYAEALAGPPVDDCRSSAETARALGRPHLPLEGCCCDFRWRPSIHMPRWASRLTLEVVSVRVERLQDITEEDARREGVDAFLYGGYDVMDPLTPAVLLNFRRLWDSINGKRASWASNPFVWRVEFKRLEAQ